MNRFAKNTFSFAFVIMTIIMCLVFSVGALKAEKKEADNVAEKNNIQVETISNKVKLFNKKLTISENAEIINKSSGSLDEIETDETWRGQWSSDVQVKTVYLTPKKTGYYDINIKDYIGTGYLCLNICDLDYDENNTSWFNTNYDIISPVTVSANNIYLIKDHTYKISLQCYKIDYLDNIIYLNADASFVISSSTYQPYVLSPDKYQNLTATHGSLDWLEFTANTTGDYLLQISQGGDTDIAIFEKESGNKLYSFNYMSNKKLRMKLTKNTDYIISVCGWGESAKLIRLKISKAAYDITRIDAVQDFTILADDGYTSATTPALLPSTITSLEYKITYSNKSTETLTYDECCNAGINITNIYYTGQIYTYKDESFFKTGKQPITIEYMKDKKSSSTIYISTYLEWCSDIRTMTDYDDMTIKYEDTNTHSYFWKIKPSVNNNYEFYSSNWSQITSYATIFDKNNQVVPYTDGFNLKGGQEYVLRQVYYYNSNCYSDVVFDMEPHRDHTHKFSTKTTIKATLSKNGKKETACTLCGYLSSSATVYYPKTFTLSATSYTYDGKVKSPTVTVKDTKGNTLKKNTDYTVSYESGRKNPGQYTVTITLKGNYSGTKKLNFTIKPKTVTGIKSTPTTTSIKLTWSKVTGATGYRVYKYNTKTKKYEKLKDVKTNSLTISKLKAATKYKYEVRAYTKDNVTLWGSYSKPFEAATKPATPNLKITSTKKGSASLSWTNVSGETGYQIYYSTKKSSDFKKLGTTKANVTQATVTQLSSKKTYYFRVRAYTKTANTTAYSDYKTVAVKVK